jgi:hypothetical protein
LCICIFINMNFLSSLIVYLALMCCESATPFKGISFQLHPRKTGNISTTLKVAKKKYNVKEFPALQASFYETAQTKTQEANTGVVFTETIETTYLTVW